MGARDSDPVEITIPSGLLLLGLPQDVRLAYIAGYDPQALIGRLRDARLALHDPVVAGQLRRLAASAQVQIPTGLDATDALIDAVGVALAHRTIMGVFLVRAPIGPAVAAPAPKPAPSSVPAFAGMSAEQRIRLLLERTPKELAPDLARAFRSLVTVEALAGIAAGFVVLLAAQFVGVGEIADAALAWWAYSQAGFSGLAGLFEVLRAVVRAVRAENEGEFDQAVKRFAEGLTLVGVALLTVVVTRAARKRAGGAEGGGGDGASSFSRPKPEPATQRWEIAPAAPKPKPAVAEETPAIDVAGGSARLRYMGATPDKFSRTGGEVVARMRNEGLIVGEGPLLRGNPNNLKLVVEDGQVPIDSSVDMAHRLDAVSWWNTTGRFYGAKSPEVRQFMLDPDNYILQPSSINRSAGAQLGQTYQPPAPPSFTTLKR